MTEWTDKSSPCIVVTSLGGPIMISIGSLEDFHNKTQSLNKPSAADIVSLLALQTHSANESQYTGTKYQWTRSSIPKNTYLDIVLVHNAASRPSVQSIKRKRQPPPLLPPQPQPHENNAIVPPFRHVLYAPVPRTLHKDPLLTNDPILSFSPKPLKPSHPPSLINSSPLLLLHHPSPLTTTLFSPCRPPTPKPQCQTPAYPSQTPQPPPPPLQPPPLFLPPPLPPPPPQTSSPTSSAAATQRASPPQSPASPRACACCPTTRSWRARGSARCAAR